MDFELVPVRQEISISGFHSIYYFEIDKHFYHAPERHDFWELVYVDYGSINAVVDGVGCSLKKGQVIFHEPMEAHCHVSDQQNASNVVVIAFACDSPLMSFFNKKIFSLEKASRKTLSLFLQEATNALGHLCGDYENKSPLDFSRAKPGAVQLMQCYLVEFLFSLIRGDETTVEALRQTPASRQMAENSLADSIIQYIQSSSYQMPSLTVLCREFSISRTYLCRIFKEATGTSPVAYWIDEKIREAKRRIRQDNYNITQISEQLGYASIHHFCRMFKRSTGVSPTAYKDMLGK